MKCPHCGGEVGLEEKFCPWCGKPNEQSVQHMEDMARFQASYRATEQSVEKKTKHVVTYFFPIVFALVAVLDIVFCAAPRLLDINCLINSNYYYNTGTVDKIGFLKNYFVIDGTYYYVNPLHNNLNEGDTVRVKHTQYSGFTLDWTCLYSRIIETSLNFPRKVSNKTLFFHFAASRRHRRLAGLYTLFIAVHAKRR